jgi:serine protease
MWSRDHVALPFFSPGAPKDTLVMQLEVVARLPEGSWAWLEAPLWLMDAMRERSPFVVVDEAREVGRLPVNPQGRRLLGEAIFPAASRAAMRLLVHIPRAHRRRPYDVYVRQLWEGQEVGRVTWRLGGDHPRPAEKTDRPKRTPKRSA